MQSNDPLCVKISSSVGEGCIDHVFFSFLFFKFPILFDALSPLGPYWLAGVGVGAALPGPANPIDSKQLA